VLMTLGEHFYIFFSQFVALILFNSLSTKMLGDLSNSLTMEYIGMCPSPSSKYCLFLRLILKPDPFVHICLDC